jgi:hypothetical protein
MSNNTAGSSKALSHWMSAAGFFLGVKWLRCEADHSPPSGANKNEWSYVYSPRMPSRCGQWELLLYFNYAKTWTWITKSHLVASKVKNITQQYFTTTIKKSYRRKHLYKKVKKKKQGKRMSHINYHHPTSDFTTLQALVGSLYWHTAIKGHCMCHCHTISWKTASLLETVECHRTQCDLIFVCGGSTMLKILLCGSHIIQQGWPTSTHWSHTTHKDSPEYQTCVYMNQKTGDWIN